MDDLIGKVKSGDLGRLCEMLRDTQRLTPRVGEVAADVIDALCKIVTEQAQQLEDINADRDR